MARGRKKRDTVIVKEVKIETPVAEEVTIPEATEEVQVESESVEEPAVASEETISSIELEELPKIEDKASEFIDEPIPVPAPVVEEKKESKVPVVDNKKDYNTNISKIISELKKNKVYKFLSKVALIKIAGDILNNKHLWK